MRKFKILSVDGGGIKGVFPASVLASFEKMAERRLVEYFDLIAGTSTGGIIALGLGMGLSAEDILSFYKEYGPKIFPASKKSYNLNNLLRRLFRSQYSPEPLKNALKKKFEDKRIGDSICRLVIPAFDANRGDVYIYKTAHHERLRTDYRVFSWQAAMATSAAPTYFPAHIDENFIRLLDGGIWANNPTMVAIVEAVSLLNVPLDQIYVLSIGCTEEPHFISTQKTQKGGKIQWAVSALEIILRGQTISATNQAALLLGLEKFFRINERVGPKRFSLDNTKAIDELYALGASVGRKKFEDINRVFLENKAPVFQPHRSLCSIEPMNEPIPQYRF